MSISRLVLRRVLEITCYERGRTCINLRSRICDGFWGEEGEKCPERTVERRLKTRNGRRPKYKSRPGGWTPAPDPSERAGRETGPGRGRSERRSGPKTTVASRNPSARRRTGTAEPSRVAVDRPASRESFDFYLKQRRPRGNDVPKRVPRRVYTGVGSVSRGRYAESSIINTNTIIIYYSLRRFDANILF